MRLRCAAFFLVTIVSTLGCSLQDFDGFQEPVLPDGSDGNVTLSVFIEGAGTGQVRSTPTSTVDCTYQCSASFPWGTTVTLEALAWSNSVFEGWSDACTGTDVCVVELTGDTIVTATFGATP